MNDPSDDTRAHLLQRYLDHRTQANAPMADGEQYFCDHLQQYSIVNEDGRLHGSGDVYRLFDHAVQHDLCEAVSFLLELTATDNIKSFVQHSIKYCNSLNMAELLCSKHVPDTSAWLVYGVQQDPMVFKHFLKHALQYRPVDEVFSNLFPIWRSGKIEHARVAIPHFDDRLLADGLVMACEHNQIPLIDCLYNTARGRYASGPCDSIIGVL